MERDNNHLYPYHPPPASSSFPNRNIDTFTQQYGELTPGPCPPPPPPSRPFLQNQAPHPSSSHHAHSLDPSFNHLLPFSHPPLPSDLAPRQYATYTNPRPHVFRSDLVPPSYHTSSHSNNDSFPFLHSPASSIQPHSAPRVHQTRKRGGYYYLDDGSAHQDVKEEEQEEEVNPTLHNPHQRRDNHFDPFLVEARARSQNPGVRSNQPPSVPAESPANEIDNLRRAIRHAREHPIMPNLANPNDLEEVNTRRNLDAKDALKWNLNPDGRTWDCYDTIKRSHIGMNRQRMMRHLRR